MRSTQPFLLTLLSVALLSACQFSADKTTSSDEATSLPTPMPPASIEAPVTPEVMPDVEEGESATDFMDIETAPGVEDDVTPETEDASQDAPYVDDATVRPRTDDGLEDGLPAEEYEAADQPYEERAHVIFEDLAKTVVDEE